MNDTVAVSVLSAELCGLKLNNVALYEVNQMRDGSFLIDAPPACEGCWKVPSEMSLVNKVSYGIYL